MKKNLTLITLILLSTTSCFAQNIHFGLRLGLTNSLLNETYNGQKGATGAVNNVDAAAYLDIDHGPITIEPGLVFFLKGGTGGNNNILYFNILPGIKQYTKIVLCRGTGECYI